jgi:hypothetical protein
MKSANWNGYVYEHIYFAEKMLGRRLGKDEVVHHLDLDRQNNRYENLVVLSPEAHAKIHAWLMRGAPTRESSRENGVNSEEAKQANKYCVVCEVTLQEKQEKYCSAFCMGVGTRRVERPSAEELSKLVKSHSILAIARMYSVSDNAVRKWIRAENACMPTLSQAACTHAEGAETSGEVKSS